MKVLVTYSSKHGSTAGIARAIGATLHTRGLAADVVPVADVGDITAYGAVIVGSAIYAGGWRKDAVRFLRSHRDLLAAVPCWIFASGPTGDAPQEVHERSGIPETVRGVVETLGPRDVRVFSGALHPEELGVIERLVVRGVGAPFGDFRNFEAIGAWASGIANALTSDPPGASMTVGTPAAVVG